jgi:uncharacterized surface protein with fasciclin (FAS1) repeats
MNSELIKHVAAIVLLSAALLFAALTTSASAHCGSCGADDAKKHPHNIVETAAAAGSFSVLLKAAEAAGMVEALVQPGPLTVFAPTDAAFAKLPKGTVEALLKDPKKLRAVLSFHVVVGNVDARAAAKAGSAPSLLGPKLTFKKGTKGLMVQNANIVSADVGASNGVIHVIDTVLLPPDA